jgi:hypothetical protein
MISKLKGFRRPVRIIFGDADPSLNSGVARTFHEFLPGSDAGGAHVVLREAALGRDRGRSRASAGQPRMTDNAGLVPTPYAPSFGRPMVFDVWGDRAGY